MPRGEKIDLATLQKMIEWFDGYSECYNADPFKIERKVNRLEKNKKEDEIVKAWADIRQDVSDIITLPDSSEEIVSAQGGLRKYRPLSAIMVFGTGLALIVLSGLHLIVSHYVVLAVLGVVLVLYAILIFQWFKGTRKLYNMVREYYRENANKVSRQRSHIRQQTQKLIDLMTVTIRTNKLEPEKYKMKLLHNDYSNIRVISESTPKNKDYVVFVSVVKARSQN